MSATSPARGASIDLTMAVAARQDIQYGMLARPAANGNGPSRTLHKLIRDAPGNTIRGNAAPAGEALAEVEVAGRPGRSQWFFRGALTVNLLSFLLKALPKSIQWT